jgi:LCP family protein required for cell wall assembly
MRSMSNNRPYAGRAAPVRGQLPPPLVGTPSGGLVARPARYPRRRNGLGQFMQGSAIGFFGGALVVSLLAAALLLFVPPGRTNVLLLGLDRRPDEVTGAVRSDTMILATINPPARYIGMLSIPRDLYVSQPLGGTDRINTAYFYGELYAAGTGPAMAMQVVSTNFGVTLNHYVRVDLAGFVNVIDAMGGIDLDVPDPLVDDEYPTYDYGTTTVEFAAGPQHMDGERALAYARIRHGSSDLQRAERQQRVIVAALQKLLSPLTWPRLPLVAAAVARSVETNLSLLEIVRLAPTLLWVGPGKIDSRVIEGDMVQPYITGGGADVLLPVWEAINPVLLSMFGQ